MVIFITITLDHIGKLTYYKSHKQRKAQRCANNLEHDPHLTVSEISMTTKSNILKSAFIAASISAGIAVAYAFQPAKTADELAEPQVDIAAKQYEVQSVNCNQICVATVKADEYNIYVEYALDDGSVEFLDILNVVRHEEAVNAYVDRYEIEKINAAIAKGER